MDGPLNPHDILNVLGEKLLQAYLVNEIQEVYRLQGVTISDKHIEVIVRQMLRWVRIEDVGDTNFLLEQQVDRFRFNEENERVLASGWPPVHRPSAAAGHHQGVALDRQLHLGRELPGDHPRPHRSLHQRSHRRTAGPQGKRHRRPPDPCRNRTRLLPQRPALTGVGRSGRARQAGSQRRVRSRRNANSK
jgi:hypothetical protein